VCFDQKQSGIVIMTNSSNGEGIFKELLETLLKDTFTPIEWEGYTPYSQLPTRKPLTARKEIHLDAKLLDRFVGRYGQLPNLILTRKREGDHLCMQENDERAQEVGAESEASFLSRAFDDELSFELDAQGHSVRMTLHVNGRDLPIKRID